MGFTWSYDFERVSCCRRSSYPTDEDREVGVETKTPDGKAYRAERLTRASSKFCIGSSRPNLNRRACCWD